MEKIGIVGLGAMGLGIAQVYAHAGHPVIATDALPDSRASAHDRMARAMQPLLDREKISEEDRNATLSRLVVTPDLADFAGATLIVEAIIEKLDAKSALFSDLEQVVAHNTVLATNTSSLSVSEIAKGLHYPNRMLGLHFFNPAPVMKLVELIAHAATTPEALSHAETLTADASKTVIRCADRPGFIVNRCARPFYGEALAIHEEGRDPAEIDAAMVAAGYRLGPFALIDLVGADINLAATENIWKAMGENARYYPFDSLRNQVATGALGRKTKRGFVTPPPDPVDPPGDSAAIVLRVEATLANEAAFLLDEGSVSETDIDTAMRLGLNFPRGPFEAARAYGLDTIRSVLSELAKTAPARLAGRYDVAPSLASLH